MSNVGRFIAVRCDRSASIILNAGKRYTTSCLFFVFVLCVYVYVRPHL